MEVNLSPDLEGKLSRAAGRGISAELLAREAITSTGSVLLRKPDG
jgi:hypothetical protein